jgi:hypothetical protein
MRAIEGCANMSPVGIALMLGTWLAADMVAAADTALQPGLYEVTFTLEMPNIIATGVGPGTVRRCVTAEDLRTGSAFGVLGDNPIRACPIKDYAISAEHAQYRIECAGPNTPFATGAFDLAPASFRGLITMNMGGKNMTMSERQRGRRLSACP